MPLYIISYDLRKQKNYEPLLKQLREWGCVRPLESVWFGNLKGPAETIRELLRQHLDQDDRMIVIELKRASDWATKAIDEIPTTWLQTNIG